ncbi:dehydrodolichyl diphosphate synthase complex subunit NUS1 [Drosophila ficusphila]|uniref:dehydrodolichyl diphosphate synthase complex subunit NUS1 n=1 Tax=Drosophila ficusphila TaxID=30025 RepID=UPI0007E821B2|nr:dehydrodolichyl diphosphate synthase complex subunit NUS1 [Drosophila ficusphila]XP_017061110.1 dehydrodolichyl diphosphate synthase complex subunit NUS1 [Drosophila ficusphila]
MFEVLCLLLGRILLLLIGSYELLWRLRERLNALWVSWSYDLWRSPAARELHERRVLADCRSQLTKTPQHLVLVISPADAGVDAVLLRRIFDFALLVGIKHVSLYDRREKDKGYVELAELCRSTSEEKGRSFVWPPSPSNSETLPKLKTNGYVNGANGSHSTQLQLHQISPSDGHALIADVCRELYQGRETPMVQDLLKQKREALTEKITGMLNQRLGFEAPEPELGMVFSRQTCTYGLLPWHVRFTEFHTHPSGRRFDVETFANILCKYSRCEQRWGT